MSNSNDVPIEVSLVHGVKACRTCKWFWGGEPPYGPYPAFDWTEDYPKQAREHGRQSDADGSPTPWLTGEVNGNQLVDPGIMHGCRKAPIMTVGINPNMTSYFPSSTGARWAYPAFAADKRYAYYYRHFTISQESLAPEYVLDHLDSDKRLLGEARGWVVSISRGSDHRWLLLTVQYEGGSETTTYEVAWTPEERWVIVKDRGKEDDSDTWFDKGDVLAGVFTPPTGETAEIYENAAGYYQRMIPVLAGFKKQVGLEDADLTIGEDIAQHDMIGCASPGWSSKYDIPTGRIAWNCVLDHGWVVSQYIQSQPAVTILVGGSALGMFSQIFGPYMDLKNDDADIFQLLKETTARPYYVSIDINGLKFKSRILTPPHFSYGSNYYQHSRLSPDAWKAFQGDFPADKKFLDDAKRVWPPAYNGVVAIEINGVDDDIQKQLSVEAWQVLMAYYYDPNEMLAGALAQEFSSGTLAFDKSTGHLTRGAGPCHFCINDVWEFPEGCDYDKPKEQPYELGYLKSVVDVILKQARKNHLNEAAKAT